MSRSIIGIVWTLGLLVAFSGQRAAADVTSDLVGHWKLNETSGSTAYDSSGYGRNGTITGSPTMELAVNGYGQTQTTSDYVTVANANAPQVGSGDFSISLWFKVINQDNKSLLSKLGSAGYRINFSATGDLGFYIKDTAANSKTLYAGTGYDDGTWHQVVAVKQTATVSIYVDGELISTNSHTVTSSVDSTASLYLGFSLEGSLDDGRIYSRALSANDVQMLYNLAAHWKLNETSGTTIADSTGHATGTITGSPTMESAVYNYGQTQATSDYVTVANADAPQLGSGDFSISLWFKGVNQVTCDLVKKYGGASYFGYMIYFAADGSLSFFVQDSVGNYSLLQAGADYDDGQWHHVVGVKGATTLSLYIDGELVNSGSHSVIGSVDYAMDLSLGKDFAGSLDELRLYRKALSADDVYYLYGCLAHWKLDETSGTVAADSSDNGADATIYGSPTMGPAVYDYGQSSNADAQYMRVGSAAAPLFGSNDLTIALWFKMTSDGSTYSYPLLHTDPNLGYELYLTTSKIHFGFGDGTNWKNFDLTANYRDGTWHHLAVVKTSTTVSMYVDGELSTSASHSVTGSLDLSDYLYIGGWGASGHTETRVYDDIRMYVRALDSDEIKTLYGLVAHWELDETSGTTAADSTGNGCDATAGGTVTWTTDCIIGTGAVDVGASDYLDYADLPTSNKNVSMAAWAKLQSTGSNEADVVTLNDRAVLRLKRNSNDLLYMTYHNGSGWVYSMNTVVSSAPATPKWHHYATVFDDNNDTVTLYYDGEAVFSGATTDSIDYGTGWNTRLGDHAAGNSGYSYDGLLDDVRIYDRAISAKEVATLYGLVAHWKMDETSGTVAADSTIFGNDATASGSIEWTTYGPVDGAVKLDAGEYLNYAGLPATTESISISAWGKLLKRDTTSYLVDMGNYYRIHLGGGGGSNVASAYYNGSGWTNNWVGGYYPEGSGWHHYAAVINASTGKNYLYYDGSEIKSINSVSIVYSGLQSSTRIGADTDGTTDNDFDGMIDDVRIYNRALAPEEVLTLYEMGTIPSVHIREWVEVR